MGNKQQLQLNNETLASILSNVLGLPSQESVKRGAYVWKKYQANTYIELTNPSATVIMKSGANNGSATTAISFMSPDFDYTPSDWAQFLDGFIITDENSALSYLMYSDGTLYVSSTQGDLTNAVTITDPSTNSSALIDLTFSTSIAMKLISSGTISYNGTKQCPLDTATKGDFIDYVVSDSPTAYPDGGEQEGYWYEKVVEGLQGEYYEVIPTSDTTTITISHTLGVTPSKILVISKTLPTLTYSTQGIFAPIFGDKSGKKGAILVNFYTTGNYPQAKIGDLSTAAELSDKSVILHSYSSSYLFQSGITYEVYILA